MPPVSHNLSLISDLRYRGYNICFVGDSIVAPILPARLPAGFYCGIVFVGGVVAYQIPSADGTFMGNRFERGSAAITHPYELTNLPAPQGTAQGIRNIDGVNLDYERAIASQWSGLIFGGASEEYLSVDRVVGAGDTLFFFRVTLSQAEGVANPRFTVTGQQMKARFLYRCTSVLTDQQDAIGLSDFTAGGDVAPVSLRTEARKRWLDGANPDLGVGEAPRTGILNAWRFDLDWVGDSGGANDIAVHATSGTNDILSVAGAVLYDPARIGATANGAFGTYIQTLGDQSWSDLAHATNAASSALEAKRYTDAELNNWRDLTTLNRAQPTLFVIHRAAEDEAQGDIETRITAIVTRLRAAEAAVGRPAPKFLLMNQIHHKIDAAWNATAFEVNEAAFLAVAQANADCCYFSPYWKTGGIQFDGGAPAQAWLAANGWATIRYGTQADDVSGGDLLDSNQLHLGSRAAAVFEAQLLSQQIDLDSTASIRLPGRLAGRLGRLSRL